MWANKETVITKFYCNAKIVNSTKGSAYATKMSDANNEQSFVISNHMSYSLGWDTKILCPCGYE